MTKTEAVNQEKIARIKKQREQYLRNVYDKMTSEAKAEGNMEAAAALRMQAWVRQQSQKVC